MNVLALRDIEKARTIKTILNLPNKQLEIIKSLSDSFAPDLASNLNTTSTSDTSKATSNQVGSYLSQERRWGSELKLEAKPSSIPFISDYDQVMVDDAQNNASGELLSKELGLLGSPETKTTYSSSELEIIIESMKSSIDSRLIGLNHLQRLIQLCTKDCSPQRIMTKNRRVIQDNLSKVMEALNECLEEDYHEVKEYALMLIKELIDFDSGYFASNLDSLIHAIIEHYPDDAPICQLEDEVLEALANSQNSTRMLQVISPLILKEEPPALQALIKTMKHIISKWGEYELVLILRTITEPLITTFNHPHANVRKSIVFCFI